MNLASARMRIISAAAGLGTAAGVLALAGGSPAAAVTCPTVNPVTHVVTPAPANAVNWSGCDLTGANLANATLTSADLNGAILTGADLTSADLTKAGLAGTILTNANLTSAVLASARLNRTNLVERPWPRRRSRAARSTRSCPGRSRARRPACRRTGP